MTLSRQAVCLASKLNIAASAALLNKTDPVQQMFLDKVKEYYKKKS